MVLEMQSEQHKVEVEAKSAADMTGHETVFVGWFHGDGDAMPRRESPEVPERASRRVEVVGIQDRPREDVGVARAP